MGLLVLEYYYASPDLLFKNRCAVKDNNVGGASH